MDFLKNLGDSISKWHDEVLDSPEYKQGYQEGQAAGVWLKEAPARAYGATSSFVSEVFSSEKKTEKK